MVIRVCWKNSDKHRSNRGKKNLSSVPRCPPQIPRVLF